MNLKVKVISIGSVGYRYNDASKNILEMIGCVTKQGVVRVNPTLKVKMK